MAFIRCRAIARTLGLKNVVANTTTSRSLTLSSRTLANIDEGIASIPNRGDYSKEGSDERRRWVEKVTNTSLSNLDGWWGPNANFDEEHLVGNCENAIGVARIPLGIIGPIQINGKYANGKFLVPAATLEGTLIASASRGCSVLNASGGVQACAFRQRMIRSPTMICIDSDHAQRLKEWIQDNFHRLHDVVLMVSKRAKLISVDSFVDDQNLTMSFVYETGEAAGQNMVTSCTIACCNWIVENIQNEEPDIGIERVVPESGLSGDKRISALNALYGRGISVVVKASIPELVLQSALKIDSTTAAEEFDTFREMCIRSGSPQTQAGNVANVLAATFAAMGQDLGSVGESSQSFVAVTKRPEGGMDLRLDMPCVTVGTVGGGTALPTQQQCLESMDCTGPKSNFKLAEIIASVCMAGDLSLMAAICSGHHASAHDKMGRNRPK